jgi:hypothetical protein
MVPFIRVADEYDQQEGYSQECYPVCSLFHNTELVVSKCRGMKRRRPEAGSIRHYLGKGAVQYRAMEGYRLLGMPGAAGSGALWRMLFRGEIAKA